MYQQRGLTPLVGVYTDPEHMSLALVDSLICFEMPIFAVAHVSPHSHAPHRSDGTSSNMLSRRVTTSIILSFTL